MEQVEEGCRISSSYDKILNKLNCLGEKKFGKLKFHKMINEEIENTICDMYGIEHGTHLSSQLLKSLQKNPTQQQLDMSHDMNTENMLNNTPQDKGGFSRDLNLYMKLTDFVDIIKPRKYVVLKFYGVPQTFHLEYKKTETLAIPWLDFWMDNYPLETVEYCTDLIHYLKIMGPLCSMINISNLINRLESTTTNYTIIIMSICVYPENDELSPISRNRTPEENEVLKQIMYEDVRRNILKIDSGVDHLLYSRSRNIVNLPAIQGSNSIE